MYVYKIYVIGLYEFHVPFPISWTWSKRIRGSILIKEGVDEKKYKIKTSMIIILTRVEKPVVNILTFIN